MLERFYVKNKFINKAADKREGMGVCRIAGEANNLK